jgi:hypothetical protein
VIPEHDDPLGGGPPEESEPDGTAERRARRAWLGSSAVARRAEAAEATVQTLEAHLADLRRRHVEADHEREKATVLLAGRERELRRVLQREYAEQQLRVEAEEAVERLRRTRRIDLDRFRRRAEEAHAAARRAEEERDVLAAQLALAGESCARLERGIAALQAVAAELRASFESDHVAARARIAELERELALARSSGPPPASADPARREEMAGALTAAVERLRARAAPEAEAAAPEVEAPAPDVPAPEVPEPPPAAPEIPTVYIVPRLFPAGVRRAGRLRPAARRFAAWLAEWAERGRDRQT